MKKRWRLETRPATAGASCGARWGPWKSSVEVHQVYCVYTSDATAANRTITLKHTLLAPAFGLADIPSSSTLVTASFDTVAITWGQGLFPVRITPTAVTAIITAALPFAFIVNVGEVIDIVCQNPQLGDGLTGPVMMVRDLDDTEHGR